MTPPSSTASRRPLLLRWALGILRALASLQLAVVLIAGTVIVLALATFIENSYGTPAVRFGVYGTWWFAAIMALLGLNVLGAALVRFPWTRRQTGFVITHAGILTLLAGCLLTRIGGIDAQLSVLEGRSESRAFEASQHFELKVLPPDAVSQPGAAPTARQHRPTETISVPFACGPFNWNDYPSLSWFPWRIASRSRGLIYDQDGIKLEVLDYLSDSRRNPVPQITLQVRGPSHTTLQEPDSPGQPSLIKLAVSTEGHPRLGGQELGMGERQTTPQGARVVFWMAGSQAETDAFVQSRPEGPLGQLGQVVLCASGKTFRFLVDELKKQTRQKLGDTGYEIELASFEPRFLAVQLRLYRNGADQPRQLALFADMPEFNKQDSAKEVFGSYWLDASAKVGEGGPMGEKMLRGAADPRIDIIQGHDQKLYYRVWKSPQFDSAGPWPTVDQSGDVIGAQLVALAKTPSPLTLSVDDFVASERPDWQVAPLPFRKRGPEHSPQPRARVRLSVDGSVDEFWLATAAARAQGEDQFHLVRSARRNVMISLPQDEVRLGFAVFLREFQRKLDPGSRKPSYYASLIDFVASPADPDLQTEMRADAQPLQSNVLVTLNEPVDFVDPHSGRSYRFFQSSFDGPWKPGDPQFDQSVAADDPRDQLFLSVFSVNNDPGRGLKYAGSLLIVVGIATMYYMRAYFFQRRPAALPGTQAPAAQAPAQLASAQR